MAKVASKKISTLEKLCDLQTRWCKRRSKSILEADAAVPKPKVASTACLTEHWKGINTFTIFYLNHNS